MSSARSVWDAVVGLLVEDGSLAIGIIVALAATWLAAAFVPDVRDLCGWLLLALLVALVVVNLRAAGIRASRQTTARS
jgi:multisubunit Na+/H+ antiporter MnhE subunit